MNTLEIEFILKFLNVKLIFLKTISEWTKAEVTTEIQSNDKLLHPFKTYDGYLKMITLDKTAIDMAKLTWVVYLAAFIKIGL